MKHGRALDPKLATKLDERKNALGQFLKESRMSAGLSQGQVADALKFTTAQFISNWENGRSSPPVKYLEKLISLYSLNVGVLYDLLIDYSVAQTEIRTRKNLERAFSSRARR